MFKFCNQKIDATFCSYFVYFNAVFPLKYWSSSWVRVGQKMSVYDFNRWIFVSLSWKLTCNNQLILFLFFRMLQCTVVSVLWQLLIGLNSIRRYSFPIRSNFSLSWNPNCEMLLSTFMSPSMANAWHSWRICGIIWC